MIKKKFHGYLKLLYMLLFITLYVGSYGSCKAWTYQENISGDLVCISPIFNSGDIQLVVDKLGLTSYYSSNIETLTTAINNRLARDCFLSGDILIDNIGFYRLGWSNDSDKSLHITIWDGDLDRNPKWHNDLYFYGSSLAIQSNNYDVNLKGFKNWNYSNNNISSVTNQWYPDYIFPYNNPQNISFTWTGSQSKLNNLGIYPNYDAISGYQQYNIFYYLLVPGFVYILPSGEELKSAGTNLGGIGYCNVVLSNVLRLDDENPPETPDSGESGESGNTTIIVNGGMTSGEFIEGNNEYWGTEVNTSGNKEQLDEGINEVMGNMSGEVLSGEVKEMMELIETKIKGKFIEEPNDFKISWANFNIKPPGSNNYIRLIPSGEVNFSKIERENEEIRNALAYMRIILNFTIIITLIHNAWNLLMDFIGVPEVKEEYGDMSVADYVGEYIKK